MDVVEKCSKISEDLMALIEAGDFIGVAQYMDDMDDNMHPSEIYTPIVFVSGYCLHPDIRDSYERLRKISAQQLNKEYKPLTDNYVAKGFVYKQGGFKIGL